MKNRWSYIQTHYPHFVGVVRLMQMTAHTSDPEVRNIALTSYNRIIAPIRDDLKQSQKEGKAPMIDADLLAYSLIGILEAVSFRVTRDNSYTLKDAEQAITEMMERLLLPRP
jgi:hypothetical protein